MNNANNIQSAYQIKVGNRFVRSYLNHATRNAALKDLIRDYPNEEIVITKIELQTGDDWQTVDTNY